jgi:class 3 adenylate cyclase
MRCEPFRACTYSTTALKSAGLDRVNTVWVQCHSCSAVCNEDARFCSQCGAPLQQASAGLVRSDDDGPTYGCERRQITIMFCDLVGSVELSTSLDPEDYAALMRRYEQAAQEAVRRFGGEIEHYIGDGLVVYFGYPTSLDAPAEHAVLAALDILTRVDALNDKSGPALQVRIGVNTGLVVLQPMGGSGGALQHVALGDVVNIAARSQSAARPGTIVVTPATRRLVARRFPTETIGLVELKGVPGPIELFEITGSMAPTTSMSSSPPESFIGRIDEMAALDRSLEDALRGKGSVVLVSGEPGMGKSSLVRQFGRANAHAANFVSMQGAQFSQNIAFAPIAQLVSEAFGWSELTTNEQRVSAVDSAVDEVGLDVDWATPAAADVLGLVVNGTGRKIPLLSAPERRAAVLQQLPEWLLRSTELRPIVLCIDDAHWIDPSTLEMIELLMKGCPERRLLILMTARSDWNVPAAWSRHVSTIALGPLSEADTRKLAVATGSSLADRGLDDMVRRSGGVPLFAVELARTAGETTSQPTRSSEEIPLTLRDALAARLDRLGSTKAVAQVAAVLGDDFDAQLLSAVSGVASDALQTNLAVLVEEGVLANTDRRHDVYVFRHALLRDAAYSSLLRSRRRELHSAAAAALNSRDLGGADTRTEVMAYHQTFAGDTEAAIATLMHLGSNAQSRWALVDAERNLTAALDLVQQIADRQTAERLELSLRIALAQHASYSHGFGSDEIIQHNDRARELSAAIASPREAMAVLFRSWAHAHSQGKVSAAQEMADQLTRRLGSEPSSTMAKHIAFAHLGCAYARGDLHRAEQMISAVFVDESTVISDGRGGLDIGVPALVHAVMTAWHTGRATEANAMAARYLEAASAPGQPSAALGFVLMTAANLAIHSQDVGGAHRHAAALTELADSGGSNYASWAQIYTGWVDVRVGNVAIGLDKMERGVGEYLASGTCTAYCQYLSWIAEGWLAAGDVGLARATVERATAALGEELIFAPSISAVRGEVLRAAGDSDGAIQAYRDGTELARAIGSAPLRLRLAVRLAEALRAAGRVGEAVNVLTTELNEVTIDRDTSDHRSATLILAELS